MLSVTIDGGELKDAAGWAVRMCPGRPESPVLAGILLETGENALTLSAYDYNTAGSTTAMASVLGGGRALVSGRLLAAIAKTLDANKDVTLTEDGSGLVLTVGRNRWVLPAMPIEDYPALPDAGEVAAKIDADLFRRALTRVLPAADRTGVDPLKGAVSLTSAGQKLTIVGLDRYRMAVAEIDWQPAEDATEIDLLVPTIFLDAGIHVLAPGAAAAEFGATSGAVYLSGGSRSLTGRLVAGEWPEWRGLLPADEQPIETIFEVAELARALDRVLAVADDERAVRFTMAPDGFTIETIHDKGSANADAPVVEYRGDGKEIAIKPKYLKEALGTMETDRAMLRTAEHPAARLNIAPVLANDEPEPGYRHIVMPMDPKKLLNR